MAETSILPSETHIATHWDTGSLGSETVALECPDPNALKRAVETLSDHVGEVAVGSIPLPPIKTCGAGVYRYSIHQLCQCVKL